MEQFHNLTLTTPPWHTSHCDFGHSMNTVHFFSSFLSVCLYTACNFESPLSLIPFLTISNFPFSCSNVIFFLCHLNTLDLLLLSSHGTLCTLTIVCAALDSNTFWTVLLLKRELCKNSAGVWFIVVSPAPRSVPATVSDPGRCLMDQ